MLNSASRFLLVWVFSFVAVVAHAADPQGKANENGTLILYDSISDRKCEIPLESGTKAYRHEYPDNMAGCSFGWPGSFELKGAKSAITIHFRSLRQANTDIINDCEGKWPVWTFRYTIKTSGAPKEPQRFDYASMDRTMINDVVVPGVRLISKSAGDNFTGKTYAQLFACVQISVSD